MFGTSICFVVVLRRQMISHSTSSHPNSATISPSIHNHVDISVHSHATPIQQPHPLAKNANYAHSKDIEAFTALKLQHCMD